MPQNACLLSHTDRMAERKSLFFTADELIVPHLDFASQKARSANFNKSGDKGLKLAHGKFGEISRKSAFTHVILDFGLPILWGTMMQNNLQEISDFKSWIHKQYSLVINWNIIAVILSVPCEQLYSQVS